ncbi:MAG: anhydro-N-acetylmuramic acid kinase [Gammaproteobacteria bacterium]|nr:anhydro-N-acetylmuramic acid kinase [Gammaproteobacteria bacterium]
MTTSELYIGLISGTSVDGVDCALVDLKSEQPQLVAAKTYPLPDDLRRFLLSLSKAQTHTLSDLGKANVVLGREFATAANSLLAETGKIKNDIVAIGSHGQTIWHEPDSEFPFSWQLGDPNSIAEQTGITTVADLRSRDIAAGGQGAPLAPLLHQVVFASPAGNRAIINIGGISNLTWLPKAGPALAYDIGPGNLLMDYWIYKNKRMSYDQDGQWATSGQVDQELLDILFADDYFTRQPPKSTGREHFNGPWLESKLTGLGRGLTPQDVQATLLQLTAISIANELNTRFPATEVYVCGGGCQNKALMQTLQQTAVDCAVHSTSTLGVDPDWVEAIAFAWMAQAAMENRTFDTRPFTGASRKLSLGAIYRA